MIYKSQPVEPRVYSVSINTVICLFKGTAGIDIELCVSVWHSIKTLKIIIALNWTKMESEVLKNVTASCGRISGSYVEVDKS
jgi:hypothetical protein